MNEFDIYTLGSGYYLEKILNAIRIIIQNPDKNSFTSIMKFSSIGAIVVLAVRAGLNNDFKSAVKWFIGVTVLLSLFLTTKAKVHIHDMLPNSYGIVQAPRTVDDVPWGLALLGSTTSQIGNYLAEKFDMAFAGTFVNSSYQETGMLFGSKIVEDISKLRIDDANLKSFVSNFYKRCMAPDLRMGYNRKNGYVIKDLVDTDDILTLLKKRSSNARMINFDIKANSPVNDSNSTSKNDNVKESYISCNKAANYIAGKLTEEVNKRESVLAKRFTSYFFADKQEIDANKVFASILTNSYGLFLKKDSKDAKDTLLQNIMINSIGDNAASYNKSFSRAATEATTSSAYYAISQMAQKFVPIYRAVLECILYGIFPLILILMVTPIGLEVLKNYGFGFIYLQMWQPMYAILFCIAGAWGKYYASGIDSLTFANQLKIAHINSEISAVAGYMLALIPILSVFVTKGMVSGMGNLASSVFYIPQTAAVNNAEQAIKGNYQVGTTQIDTHSYNNTSSNKYDDNYSWMSGMKSFAMQSGAQEKMFADGRTGIDSTGALSNLGGLIKIDWQKMMGNRYDQSISDHMSNASRYASSSVESATSGYSKLFGFDQHYSQGSNTHQNLMKGFSQEDRQSINEARDYVESFAKELKLDRMDALRLAFGTKGLPASIEASTLGQKSMSNNESLKSSSTNQLANSLSKVENIVLSNQYQSNDSVSSSMLDNVRSDFNEARAASFEASKSMDHVHSLQQSKSNFEQNSASISQDYNNKFAEDKIKEYGAGATEQMIRDNPDRTYQEASKWLDNRLALNSNILQKDFTDSNEIMLSSKQVKDRHYAQKEELKIYNQNNIREVENVSPKNFNNNIKKKTENTDLKQEVLSLQTATDHTFAHKEKTLSIINESLKQNVKEKNNDSASKTVYDAVSRPDQIKLNINNKK
ncbi:conjugal transfer mating pair stabilization protein TraG (plasmid) [Rickettsiales bacterium Ac37b]|nr:conjugal transfer mating pair stabilization protein TraG [Rickettsiales bacterium Ac37b]